MKTVTLSLMVFAIAFVAKSPSRATENLPLDSQGLIEKLAQFESTELREVKHRIAEKKQLVIEALIAHYKREDSNGNQVAALAIRQEIEKMDGGQRRFTQGLDSMTADPSGASGSPSEKALQIPDPPTRIGTQYYQLFGDRVSRGGDAKARCEQMGGRLAIIDNDRIFEKYVDEVRKAYNFNACWTGGKFDKANQRWVWESDEIERFDEKLIREDAEIGSPDYDWLCMDITTGKLFSKPGNAMHAYFCEWEDE